MKGDEKNNVKLKKQPFKFKNLSIENCPAAAGSRQAE